MSENEQNNTLSKKRMWILILVMGGILFFGPFEIELRWSTYFFPSVSFTDFIVYSWIWVYSVIGHDPNGFITYPSYLLFQNVLFQGLFPLLFFLTFIGYQIGISSRVTTLTIGFVSLFPGLLILTVNVLLGILSPSGGEIIVPIPIPIVSIIGLYLLRHKKIPEETDEIDSWLKQE